jgi:hypothetical protein
MSEDPHDWWNAICKRCGTSHTAYSNGEAPTCREESRVVSQHAADDFAYIAKRNKEIAEERTALVGASVSYRVADYLTDQTAVWISAWEDDGGW